MKNLYLSLVFLFICSLLTAQTGTVKGVITDANTTETIPFANVLITNSTAGFTTDLDGAFSYDLEAGTYSFEVSYIGFEKKILEDVAIVAGQVTTLDIQLEENSKQLEEVVISAKQLRNTENAVMAIQRKSVHVVNGISSQSFRKNGDSNAGAAIKRVTGVSIAGGKYVFIRGLGDRYSKTILNGLEIPGLDPDRNSLQIDVFPTSIIDNLLVSKTSRADFSGDFSGGIVNITTKDFPEEKTMNLSLGLGYNPNMHLNSNFVHSQSSSTDFLGFDNGLRDLRINKFQEIPSPIDEPILTQLTSRLENNMATERTNSLGNLNLGFSLGNLVKKGEASIGYNAVLSYRNNTTFYQDAQFNNYIKSSDASEMELLQDRESTGDIGSVNALLSGMLGTALKYKDHSISVMALHLQNGESKSGLFERSNFIRASNTLLSDNIEYTERSISNLLLNGRHTFGTFELDWKYSPTLSRIEDKDIRITPFKLNDDGALSFEPSEGAQPRRLWRNLNEINHSARVDLKKSMGFMDREMDLKFGVSNIYKQRDYEILSYLINVKGQNSLDLTGDPNELLLVDNIWTPEKQVGTYVAGNFEPTNTYDATQNILAAYVMTDVDLFSKLKANVGLRAEKFTHNYTGQNNTGSVVYNNERIIDNFNLLPSVNLIYGLSDKMNLRTSFSKTVARPSFKEASIAQIYDAISDQTFIGNIELSQTDIDNYDLRWEAFYKEGQMFSLSGFYKNFRNPIELVAFSSSAPNDLQPRNIGNAQVTGLEFEFRNNLSFLSKSLNSLYAGANVTVVKSQVELDQSDNGEYESRLANVREGETIKTTRQMQGQSPYIVNGYLNYTNPSNAWEVNLSYNVQGPSLAIVGIGLNPDVYTNPFHDLSFKVSKSFGEGNKFRLSAGANNLLNSNKEMVYRSYGTEDQIYQQFRPFRTMSVSLNWKLAAN